MGRRGRKGGTQKNAERRRDLRCRTSRVREQTGFAERDACCRAYRETRLAQHAKPSMVPPVGMRDVRRRPLRGPRLDVGDVENEKEVSQGAARTAAAHGGCRLPSGRVNRQFGPVLLDSAVAYRDGASWPKK